MPRETILDTGAEKVMLSKSFAAAMYVHEADLEKGFDFAAASGAVEEPMGVTKKKVVFTLSRGTPRECRVSLFVTVVDTTTYDALLGMKFMAAVRGYYDTYTEMFKYRRVGLDGLTHSFEVIAPFHLSSPPLTAYAFFGGAATRRLRC